MGSNQVMTISGISSDGGARLVLFDSFGAICVNVGASSTTFHGLADSSVDGGTLVFAWRHVACGNVEAVLFRASQYSSDTVSPGV